MEIERKYLVKEVPRNLSQYKSVMIEQGYLTVDPTIRIRRIGEEYKLTYKTRNHIVPVRETNVAEEVELPLSQTAYEHLRGKIDGRFIEKTRYYIPLPQNLTVELDIFHGYFEGRVLAEVEFPSLETANQFEKPDWFGENVSNQKKYINSFMALGEK